MGMEHEGHGGCGCGCGGAPALDNELARRWRDAPDDEAVCPCAGVDKGAVKAAIAAGAYTAPLVKAMTGVGREAGCRQRRECQADLGVLVALYADGQTNFC
ncbi:MAG: (2Fe-2S)-binding protein [Proteobacteria bacterium]|nr:(2Fe-2S)-binding protein [Pseudomonadota bacterium]